MDEKKPPLKKNNKWILIFLGILFLFLLAAVGMYFSRYADHTPQFFTPTEAFIKPEISVGADIIISLPREYIDMPRENVYFVPEIEGEWIDGEENTIVFRPKNILEQGSYYSIGLKTETGEITRDFKVVEAPKIVSVFPQPDSETNEYNDVTVIFNRPMVPLTTLDVLDTFDIPIEISPETEGRWRWKGTRTLQFQPSERLQRSSNYTVKIAPDFVSEDNLEVEGMETKFITRPLRLEYITSKIIMYRQPIWVRFNQPVDLEKTKEFISLEEISPLTPEISQGLTETEEKTPQKIPEPKPENFILEYGTTRDENGNEVEDKSLLLVFQKADEHGREKLWDFDHTYTVKITKAIPEEGDIFWEQERTSRVKITNVISSFDAESERSYYSAEDFFDPAGTVEVTFYEEVDIDKTKITSEKIENISYGEKCKEGQEDAYFADDVECEKEEDKTVLILDFKENEIEKKEEIEIIFEEIVNSKGEKINFTPITRKIISIPDFALTKTSVDGGANVDVMSLNLCTTTPLVQPDKEDIGEYIKTPQGYGFWSWGRSYKISRNNTYSICSTGEFETSINYRLTPETEYKMKLKLEDVFGDVTEKDLHFTTRIIPDRLLSFRAMQPIYNVTTPEKTRLTYTVENMEYINMHICQLSAENMLHVINKKPYRTASYKAVPNCIFEKNAVVDVEDKYWVKNPFQVKISDYVEDTYGHFVVTFWHPNYTRSNWRNGQKFEEILYERTYLTVTSLGVVEKKIKNKEFSDTTNVREEFGLSDEQRKDLRHLFWVTDLEKLEPVEGANISLFTQYENPSAYSAEHVKKAKEFSTDKKGIAQSHAYADHVGSIVKYKNSSVVLPKTSESQLRSGGWAENIKKTYIYTDRPIYRPGDEVQIKGIVRNTYDGEFDIPEGKKMNLTMRHWGNSGGKGTTGNFYEQEVSINDYGTFGATITLDEGAPLGTYEMETEGGQTSFSIEEYKPAPFRVMASETNKKEYIAGENVELTVNAEYYFGAPLEGGEVTYSINSQDYYFDKYTDEWFQFGTGWYSCWYDCDYGDKFLMRNKAKIQPDGSAKIQFNLDFKQFFPKEEDRKSKIISVFMTVKNSTGESVTAEKSFVVHRGDFYLGLKTNNMFPEAGKDFEVKVKSVDTEGKEKKVKNINLSISKIDWIHNRRKEVDGGYYYQWERVYEDILTEKISTDGKGDWSKENFNIENPGEYRIQILTTDENGNEVKSSMEIYVHGGWGGYDPQIIRPYNTSLEVVTDDNDLDIGDTARILIKNPFPKAKAMISIERGDVYEYEIVDINQPLYEYSFPITKQYVPNVYASVTLITSDSPQKRRTSTVGDQEIEQISGGPAVRHGEVHFRVDPQNKELNINITPTKSHYLPGEEVTLNFDVTKKDGSPAETELSVAVVDMSVLALKGNPKENPLVFFWNNKPLMITTSSNLKNALEEIDIKGGKGGGGGGEGELAKKKRGEFRDTAFWEATVLTNTEGKANITFTLPDNLTLWQVESIGVTKDTEVGAGYQEFTARKPVMVSPLKPRFVVPGDQFSLGAKVFNQSEENQTFTVGFESMTILGEGEINLDISLDAGETKTIYFPVKAPEEMQKGFHEFTLYAKNNQHEDIVVQSTKITPNDTYETVATANYSNAEQETEFLFLPENIVPEKGSLKINVSATLAVFLSDGLNSLLSFPYGCSEQIASKLEAIAIVKKGMNLENIGNQFNIKEMEFDGKTYSLEEGVRKGLARLYENQVVDGGFTYYKNWHSNFYLTARVVKTLVSLQEAGFEIDQNKINNGLLFLSNKVRYDQDYQEKYSIITAAEAHSQAGKLSENEFLMAQLNEKVLNDEAWLHESANPNTLATLAMILANDKKEFSDEKQEEVFSTLQNLLKIDARGAYISVGGERHWYNYETTERNTALALKALVLNKQDNKVLGKILRWLLNSREKDGAWGTTANTIAVVDAFTEYLVWQEENESDFDLNIFIDQKNIGAFEFSPENIFAQESSKISPLNELPFGKLMPVEFEKTNNNDKKNNFYYDISLKYYLPINTIPPRDEGFFIERNFYELYDKGLEYPVKSAKVGDILRGRIKIIVPEHRNFVAVEDFLPAGVELVNFDFATEDKSMLEQYDVPTNYSAPGSIAGYGYSRRTKLYENPFHAQTEELRDDRVFLFSENVRPGVYTYDYYVRVLIPGKYHHLPAVVSEMYFPENFGRTRGDYFEVEK